MNGTQWPERWIKGLVLRLIISPLQAVFTLPGTLHRKIARLPDALRWYAKTHWPLRILHQINAGLRALCTLTHAWQFHLEWRIPPAPEWYDQFLAVHYNLRRLQQPYAWERGIFNLMVMDQGARVLELCCGGGFFTYYCYAGRASHIAAVDFDPTAITHAQRHNQAANITYSVRDIRHQLPTGPFDNVVIDAAIEHFTEMEIAEIMGRVKDSLAPGGRIIGSTLVQKGSDFRHDDHEYEFSSKQDLARFLSPHFRNIQVIETTYPDRTNLYFFASDEALPLDHAMLKWESGREYPIASDT